MDNNANKEKWINEVLDSTKSMSRAQPGPDLYEKISRKLNTLKKIATIPLYIKQLAAAAVLLVFVNVGSIIYLSGRGQKTATTTNENTLATEIGSVTTYNY